ncbi:MAG: hypothetical protein AB7N70_16780 [Dehalococcoidia bacterium]
MNRPVRWLPSRHVVALLLMMFGLSAKADDVQFLLLEKFATYHVNDQDQLTLEDYEFISDTMLNKGGAILTGSVTRKSTGERVFELKPSEGFYNHYPKSYSSLQLLDAAHPNEEYLMNVTGKSSAIKDLVLNFAGPAGAAQFPDAVTVKLIQNGQVVSRSAVNPDAELSIVWSPFTKGAKDPRGVLDDLIVASVNDCTGAKVAHSGIPFVTPQHLDFRGEKLVVPAGKLTAGVTYNVAVTHVHSVDTAKVGETTAMATYNSKTKLNFTTTGTATTIDCAATESGKK